MSPSMFVIPVYIQLIYKLICNTSELSPECQVQSPMTQWRSHRFHNVFKFRDKENTFPHLKKYISNKLFKKQCKW